MSDPRPTALQRMSPAIRSALEAAARRGVDTAAIALGIAPQGKRAPLVGGAKRGDEEFEIQREFFAAIDADAVLADLPIYAVPNFFGNYGTVKQRQLAGARAQATGRRKGVPDVCVDVARGGWHGLRIEFKTEDGSVMREQHEWRERLERHGFHVVVCRSSHEALTLLTHYLALPASGERAQLGSFPQRRGSRNVRPPGP